MTITGPRSDPPMPMFTTSVIAWPEYPFHFPARIASQNSRMCFSTAFTSGITSFPSTKIGLFDRFRVVEITLDQPMDLPRDLPPTWLNVERASVVIRFTDSRFDNTLTHDEVRRRFPGAREVTARVMTLRAIVVALMKSAKPAKAGTELMACI